MAYIRVGQEWVEVEIASESIVLIGAIAMAEYAGDSISVVKTTVVVEVDEEIYVPVAPSSLTVTEV